MIPIRWNEKNRTLTLGSRQGSYPGMPQNRIFRIVWMRSENPKSTDVHFNGSELRIQEPQRQTETER